MVSAVLKEMPFTCHAFDLEKDIRVRRNIDRTSDFNDFKALFSDRYGVKKGDILFIDEAQESTVPADYVRSFKEDWPEVKFILTSRHLLLLEYFDEYISVGGYPEVVKAYESGESPHKVMDEIMASLAEDLQRKEEYHPGLFQDLIRAVADHVGGPSKYSHIDESKYRSKQAIEAMRAWHIVLEVEQRAIVPHKGRFLSKRYLHDIGVANRRRTLAVPKIFVLDTIDSALRIPLGGLFENAVLLNLLEGESTYKSIGTWKKGNNTDIEVDFVRDLPEERAAIPIECKASLKLYNRHFKNIKVLLNLPIYSDRLSDFAPASCLFASGWIIKITINKLRGIDFDRGTVHRLPRPE